jgi:signal transduction histidine kinase
MAQMFETTNWMAGQTDYLLLAHGLALALLVTSAQAVARADRRMAWRWLMAFGVAEGLHAWLEMASAALGDSAVFQTVRLELRALSALSLVFFGKTSSAQAGSRPRLAASLAPPVLLAVFTAFARPGAEHGFALYALVIPGALWSAWAVRQYRLRWFPRSRSLLCVGGMLPAWALLSGAGNAAEWFFPDGSRGGGAFPSHLYVVLAPLSVAAGGMAIALWRHRWTLHAERAGSAAGKERAGLWFLVGLALAMAVGWVGTETTGRKADRGERTKLLNVAGTAAAAVSPNRLARLAGGPPDRANPDYQVLRTQLMRMHAATRNTGISRYCVLMRHAGRVLVVADSRWDTPPGAPHAAPPEVVYHALTTGSPEIGGPFHGAGGSYVSGLVAVRAPGSQRVAAVLEVDMDASLLVGARANQRLVAILIVLLVCGLLLGFFVFWARNREAASALRASHAQVAEAQRMASLGTLAGGVAHEINNPINGVMNYAQLISDRLEAGSPLREYSEEIIRESERIGRIVGNLLVFAGQERRSRSPARMADLVERTLSLMRTALLKDGITLRVDVPETLPDVLCRSQQIQQALMNLLSNARDALNRRYPGGDPGKVLAVTGRRVESAGATLVRVTVEDRGTGIAPEVRRRLFEPFFTTASRSQRSGMGLAVALGIVTEHGGELSVESEPGQYARFHMDLPAGP